MPNEQTKLILNQMLADHETAFGPDLWQEARVHPSKFAVDAIVRSLITWDDQLQLWAHSHEFFSPLEFRAAVCARLGFAYDDLSDDLPDIPDDGWSIVRWYFIFLGLGVVLGIVRVTFGWA